MDYNFITPEDWRNEQNKYFSVFMQNIIFVIPLYFYNKNNKIN